MNLKLDIGGVILVYEKLKTIIEKFITKKNKKIPSKSGGYLFILLSFFSLLIVGLLLYLLKLSPDSAVLKSLTSGEVIAGILLLVPTTCTWYIDKKNNESEIYREGLRAQYLKWIEDFSSTENNLSDSVLRIRLDVLLNNEANQKNKCIDYEVLFTIIQKKAEVIEEGITTDAWRSININILKIIKEKYNDNYYEIIKKVIHSEDVKRLCLIDFDKLEISELFNFNEMTVISPVMKFDNCVLKIDDLNKIENNKVPIPCQFRNCVFDKDPVIIAQNNREESRKISFENCYQKKGRFFEKYVDIEGRLRAQERISLENTKSEIKHDEYYDARNIGLKCIINGYLHGKKGYNIEIDDNNNSSINNKIISKVKEKMGISELNSENFIVSKSKSYIPEKDTENYEWYSWNVLKGNQIENQKYIIFAVQRFHEKNRYLCLIFEKDNFEELYYGLYNFGKEYNEERYYFNFVEKK